MPEDLLIRAARIQPEDNVLDLGWDGRSLAPRIASGCHSITFASPDIRAVQAVSGLSAKPQHDISAIHTTEIPAGPFSAALYKPVRWSAKPRVFEMLQGCFLALEAGGRLCLAGRRAAGVESYAKRLEALFGQVRVLSRKGGTRVYEAEKASESPGVPPPEARRCFSVPDLPGGPYTFETRAGVFSWDGVDPGTRLLIECSDVGPEDRVLDLGCGFGAVGIVAARDAHRGRVVLSDVDALALECARRNVDLNRAANATVAVSDGLSDLADAEFDLVLSNPPTHQGSAIAHAFVAGAAGKLHPDGRFCVVVRRPAMYARPMDKYFKKTDRLVDSEGYTVIRSQFPLPA